MTTGRTNTQKYSRVYVDGYDLSGYSRSIGPLSCTFEEGIDDAITLSVKQVWPGNAVISAGVLNGIYDNTATTGLHALMSGAGVKRNLMVPIGIQAVPANNDPVFCGQFLQGAYISGPDGNPVTVSIPFNQASALSANLQYAIPWGALLHANAAATAANTAAGLDQLAQSLKGGWMMYQVFAAAGTGSKTATIKVQHADTNTDGSFADLLSSGEINCAAGVSGVVQLEPGTTVERYVRWQLALNTATSVTFALAFMRNYI